MKGRVLACVQCQQRKIKCNREFPCSHCTKSGHQCTPAHLVAKQRRRRFPERELLDRLRHYEDLLTQHNIGFEPLHPTSDASKHEDPQKASSIDRETSSTSIKNSEDTTPESVNLWSAVTQTSSGDEASGDDVDFSAREMGERMIKKAWEQSDYSKDDMIMSTPVSDIDLSMLHPPPPQIFKLWQIYLDNVDPLLKVTHTPTLQPRIIDAISNLANSGASLNALMFGIYCAALNSLNDEECWSMFAVSKDDFLSRCRFACRQSLHKANFLRSEDVDCLTAMYLNSVRIAMPIMLPKLMDCQFLQISTKASIDARSLSSTMGITIRIAQRMGIHDQSTYKNFTPFEAEIRRRLWWSLVVFDNRICEMANSLKATLLLPTWDCGVPNNLNDFDMNTDMKSMKPIVDGPSQAVFAVVRSRIANFLRHSNFYLSFNIPALKALVLRQNHDAGKLDDFEKWIESQFLQHCDPENPLHYMTIWTTRGLFAKNRLWEHISQFHKPSAHQTDAERDTAVIYALRTIECDTKLLSSPLTKRFEWYVKAYSFFPAYIHIIQDLRKRPLHTHAGKAWQVMSEDWQARHHGNLELDGNPFFAMFSRIVLQAWEVREVALAHRRLAQEPPPGIVEDMRQKLKPQVPPVMDTQTEYQSAGLDAMDMNFDDFLTNLMPMPMDFMDESVPFDFGAQTYTQNGHVDA